jgi:hypothetical protein
VSLECSASHKLLLTSWMNWILAGKVAGRAVEHRVPHVGPGEDYLKLMVRPGSSRKVLKEHHHFLKIQFLKLF